MPRRTLTLLLLFIAVAALCYQRADHSPYARYLADAFEKIDEHYLERVDEKQLFDAGVKAMVGRLDSYSGFISRDEARRFHQALDQRFGGIGIEVRQDPETKMLVISTPVLATPAYRAGLRAGDTILAIDGRSLAAIAPKQRLEAAVKLMQGKEGESVTLRYRRPGIAAPLEAKLTRAIVQIDSVLGNARRADNSWDYSLIQHQRLGYVRITTFAEHTVEEFKSALQSLHARGCQGLVIDLRDNRGGLLKSAPEICELFLPAGSLIVSTRDRRGHVKDEYRAEGQPSYPRLPLVVLVNGESASASEIVAACLQDHQRAKIVGERTWGKGTVQHVLNIEGGQSRLRLTTSSYWRPNGQNIHRFQTSKDEDPWGVRPDAGCEIVLDAEQRARLLAERRKRDVVWPPGSRPPDAAHPAAAAEFDPALAKAIELLQSEIHG